MGRIMITLDEKTQIFLNEYKEEHGMRFNGDAIAAICREYEELKKKSFSVAYVTEVVSKQMQEVFKAELNKIRLASNSADRNTQILLELMNGIYCNDNLTLISTNDFESEGLKTAKAVVQERISNSRQKKLDYEASKGGN